MIKYNIIMEKLTINDLPEDVVERMRRAIREDSQMIALKNKHSQYIINRQYAKAVLLKKEDAGDRGTGDT